MYNDCIHSLTHRTPFKLDTGQHPCMGAEPPRSSMVEVANDFVKCMAALQSKAKGV